MSFEGFSKKFEDITERAYLELSTLITGKLFEIYFLSSTTTNLAPLPKASSTYSWPSKSLPLMATKHEFGLTFLESYTIFSISVSSRIFPV